MNWHFAEHPLTSAPVKSKAIISAADDAAVDREIPKTNGAVKPGISIANGPVDAMDIDKPNGTTNGKRKASLPNGKSYKDASDDEDDLPLKKRKTTATADDSDDEPLVRKVVKPVPIKADQIGEKSDKGLVEKLQKQKAEIEKKAAQEAQAIRKDESTSRRKSKKVDSEDEDDVPLIKKAAAAKKAAPKKAAPAKGKAATPVKKGKAAVKKEEEEEEEAEEDEYRWWDDPSKGDGTIKWTTLAHNGVVFPPDYEPLPKNVRMLYGGQPVTMHPDAEEIAYAFGSMLNSEHNVQNPTFQKNFFEDFKAMLDKTGQAKDKNGKRVNITEFEKCDFKPIFNHVEAERAAKKALTTAEKKALKAEKDEKEAPYMYCLWDGRKQKVGNFRVEPPGLFRGRGEHPKTGRFKKRVPPEQITINIGKEATVPRPPEGHNWKEIKHDQEGTWLAMWQENINGAYKYVMLAANSDVKGQSDFKKFEKARELKKHIDKIRKDYKKELKSDSMAERQRATAVYLIDQFALRAGNEKGEDEADTVGCCSLKFEHITLSPPNKVVFDFLGKDSIRFYDEVEVDPQVFKNLKIFKRAPKREGDEIFDRLTTSSLNKHLSNYMPGLTAKVFRTYNASFTMATLLKEMTAKGSIPEKVKAYNDANRRVAILCNHKRTVGAGHAVQMEKMVNSINALRYQQWRVKQMMLAEEPKLKKKKGAEHFALPSDLTKEWIESHHASLVEAEKVKITKKFEKENEKLVSEDSKPMKDKELKERLEAATEMEKKFKAERKTGKVLPEGRNPSVEKYEKDLEKLDTRIATLQLQSEDRENNKEVALGTSKIVSFYLSLFLFYPFLPFNFSSCVLDIVGGVLIFSRRRITSTPASRSFSPRNMMSPLNASSPRPSERNSSGLLNRRMRIGSFRGWWRWFATKSCSCSGMKSWVD
jgi:DNA topoisomerase-1